MPPPREKPRSYWLVRYEPGGAGVPVAVEARDAPAAWRRAEREARGTSFALYDPECKLLRVGVAPPAAMAALAPATAVALSVDGETVITGHEDGALRVHDARTGARKWERSLGAARVEHVVVPERAPWLLACTRAGEVWVLDRARGEPVLHLIDGEARALALSPDERTLALGGAVVELWSLPGGERLGTLEGAARGAGADDAADGDDADEGGDDGVHAVGFAAGGARVVAACAGRGGELIVWDRATGRRVACRAEFPVTRIAFARDGRSAVVGAEHDGAVVRVLDLATLETRTVCATGAEGLWDVRLTPDDRYALVHDEETGIYVVDVASGATHAWLDEFEGCAYVVGRARAAAGARARDGRGAAVAECTRVVPLPRWRRGDPGAPLSGDGRRYAALRHQGETTLVALFDLAGCLPYAALAHAQPVESVWLNRDGTRGATRDARGRVFVWDVPDAPERLG